MMATEDGVVEEAVEGCAEETEEEAHRQEHIESALFQVTTMLGLDNWKIWVSADNEVKNTTGLRLL